MTIMRTYAVKLSNDKTLSVTAPSPQRARLRVEREIGKRESSVTVISVKEIEDND